MTETVDDHFKDMGLKREKEKKEHPIRYFFYYHVYLTAYRLWNNHISMWHKEIYWFFQRGFRGYSDRDCWSFDNYLAQIITGGVKHLKKHKIGYPMPEWFKEPRDMTSEEERKAINEWNETLDTIIFAFDMIYKEGCGTVYYWYEGCEKAYEHLKEKYSDLYKDVHFLTEDEQKKVELGRQLFTKHFHDLWD